MRSRGAEHPAVTVTSEYTVRLHRPTPMDKALRLEARATEINGRKIKVEAQLSAEGTVTASCKGIFIAVRADHPAARSW